MVSKNTMVLNTLRCSALAKTEVSYTSISEKTALILKYIKKRSIPLFLKLKYWFAWHDNTTVLEHCGFRKKNFVAKLGLNLQQTLSSLNKRSRSFPICHGGARDRSRTCVCHARRRPAATNMVICRKTTLSHGGHGYRWRVPRPS